MSTTSGVTLTPFSKVEPIDAVAIRFDQSLDSSVAPYLGRMYGEARFPGIRNCPIEAVRDGGRALLEQAGGDPDLIVEETRRLPLGIAGGPFDEHGGARFRLGRWEKAPRKKGCSTTLLCDAIFGETGQQEPVGLQRLCRYVRYDDAAASWQMDLSLGAVMRTMRNYTLRGRPHDQLRFVDVAMQAYFWSAGRYAADKTKRPPSRPDVDFLLEQLESWKKRQAELVAARAANTALGASMSAPEEFQPELLEKLETLIKKGPSEKAKGEKFSAFELSCLAKTVGEYSEEMGDDVSEEWLYPIFLALYRKYKARSEAVQVIKSGGVEMRLVSYGGHPIVLAIYRGDNGEVKNRLAKISKKTGRPMADVLVQMEKTGRFRISTLSKRVMLESVAVRLGKAEYVRNGGPRNHQIPDWVWSYQGVMPSPADSIFNFSPERAKGIAVIMHGSHAVPDAPVSSFAGKLDELVEFVEEGLSEAKVAPRPKKSGKKPARSNR